MIFLFFFFFFSSRRRHTRFDCDWSSDVCSSDLDRVSSDQLMGRYSISDNTESDPNPFPALGRPSLHSRAQSVVLSETHFLSPKWIDNARASYYRSIFLFGPVLEGSNVNGQAGI